MQRMTWRATSTRPYLHAELAHQASHRAGSIHTSARGGSTSLFAQPVSTPSPVAACFRDNKTAQVELEREASHGARPYHREARRGVHGSSVRA